MKNKRLNKVLMSLGIALVIPTSAFASVEPLSAGWDNKGSQSPTIYTSKYVSTLVYSSGGGNWKMEVRNVDVSGNSYLVQLYEQDPSGNTPIGPTQRYTGSEDIIWDVSGYTDGDNGKAEIFAQIGYAESQEQVTLTMYD